MFHRLGLDIIRIKNSPKQTLCGLRSLPIQTVIDVGANTGQFARQISQVFHKPTCIASNLCLSHS